MNNIEYIPNEEKSFIGEGGFAKTYHILYNGEECCLKKLKDEEKNDDDSIKRFRREIELLELLNGHPNIIDLIHSNKDELYYVMPFANKSNLEKYCQNKKLTNEIKLNIFDQILNAIVYAHSKGKGIIHRDLNPRNVLVFESSSKLNVKVADFGLGKNYDKNSNYTKSKTHSLGQEDYAAPEQLGSLKEATFQSDIYSLGLLLYFTWTNKRPRHIKPTLFLDIINQATSENYSDRQTITQFKDKYEKIKAIILGTNNKLSNISLHNMQEDNSLFDWDLFFILIEDIEKNNDDYDKFYFYPIYDLLDDKKRLTELVSFSEDRIIWFIEKITNNFNLIYSYDLLDRYSILMDKILRATKNDTIKVFAFMSIWALAFDKGQHIAQGHITSIFKEKLLSENIIHTICVKIDAIKVSYINGNIIKILKYIPTSIQAILEQ